MAKAKQTNRKGSKENPVDSEPDFVVKEASIKNGLLNYSYEILKGPNRGFTHNVKGKGIVKDSLHEAFNDFRVHLAIMDEVFKHSGIEVEGISKVDNHELVQNYMVTGMKLKGDEGSESLVLVGSKYTGLGSIDITTPQVAIDNLSSYTWYNELRDAVDQVRREVELYMDGNFEAPEEEEKPKYKQPELGADMDGIDNEMEGAAV